MSAAGHRRACDRGFTLIEAMVVVAITGLISALMFPSLQRTLATLSVRETAGVLASNLQVARADAIRTGIPMTVAVADDGRSYSATDEQSVVAPADVRLAAGGGRAIVFYGDASTTGGVIAVEGEGRRIYVDVDPSSGAVSRRGA